MADPRLTMAYEAIQQNLANQDGTLANLRNRATGLFSAAAVVTTFSSAVGLLNTDAAKGPTLPVGSAVVSLGLVVLIGICAMYALWPVKAWAYGPSGKKILTDIENGKSEDEIRKALTEVLSEKVRSNSDVIRRRARAYQAGTVLLGVEVVVLVLPMALR